MKLLLLVNHSRLGFDLAAHLEEKQSGRISASVSVSPASSPVELFGLHYREGLPLREVSFLLDALAPLVPDEIVEDDVKGYNCDAILFLGESGGIHERVVHLVVDSLAHANQMAGLLTDLRFKPQLAPVQGVHQDLLMWSGLSRFSLQMMRWYLQRWGHFVQVREDSNYADCFCLQLRDPALLETPACQRFPVEVACDDPVLGKQLLDLLTGRGFTRCSLVSLPAYEAETLPFSVNPGAFLQERYPSENDHLQRALYDCFRRLKIDEGKFPVNLNQGEGLTAHIRAPLGAVVAGRKIPYSGGFPERFHVSVVTDDEAGVERLRQRLLDAGFRQVEVIVRPSLLEGPDDGSEGEFHPGYVTTWNEAAGHAALVTMINGAMKAEMAALGAKDFALRRQDSCIGDSTAIRLYFPVQGATDGRLLERIADPTFHRIRIRTGYPEGWNGIIDELRSWGFTDFYVEANSNSAMLYYGGAPAPLLERIRTAVRRHNGPDLPMSKAWDDNNNELYVDLPDRQPPARSGEETRLPEEMTPQLEAWAYGDAGGDAVHSFLDVTADRVRVGNVWLPRHPGPRKKLAPHPATFSHFCLDRLTAATLEHIATSVLLREPCLLEGETSTSKTSSILFLASLMNQPVARLNLNGQTDTGELIGRFVPQHLILELPLSYQELVAAADLLEAETIKILEKARRENRQLTRIEIQQIMAQEEMTSHPWRWEDGLVPQAMREGWWILLDEVNLAEPQILERLNSVLEADPGLILTEYDNSLIGPGGDPVHADFRIFGTMNPAEYAGRSVLSPAYRDRWRGYRNVPRPGESEFLDMLCLLVYGNQPDFSLHGGNFLGADQEPRYHRLAKLPQIGDFLESLARFHVALENAVGQGVDSVARIGGRRRERYVFTRRGLLSLLDYLSSPLFEDQEALSDRALRQGLLRYYLGRLSSAEDRTLVIQLLDAHGMGPNTWKFS